MSHVRERFRSVLANPTCTLAANIEVERMGGDLRPGRSSKRHRGRIGTRARGVQVLVRDRALERVAVEDKRQAVRGEEVGAVLQPEVQVGSA
jgi:hypothetical protein